MPARCRRSRATATVFSPDKEPNEPHNPSLDVSKHDFTADDGHFTDNGANEVTDVDISTVTGALTS